ncbi:conjugal transfer protein TraN [Pseudomonas asuensis]|uniref:Conjugal transfer protein TraN n=1 Tax=Pseudomonas asuensis TaxID=1825787 RepID=A0ABQ2H2Y9_9PSED|nr:DotH/IcmK family type IV secretion protein [Pseudomonas asuensis]GGM26069.1 conjugal transfer protein TraN [Pseudomonas asuensis]
MNLFSLKSVIHLIAMGAISSAWAQESSPSTQGQPQFVPQQAMQVQSQQSQMQDRPVQWVNASTGGQPFPTPPGQASVSSSQQMIQAAFPPSNYGAANYNVAGSQAAPPQQGSYQQTPSQNGMANLPPLTPPSALQQAEQVVAPWPANDIKEIRGHLEETRKAMGYEPVRAIPRISSTSIDLSPGAAIPIVRSMPGQMSTLVFVDSTGAPWPLAAPPRSTGGNIFQVEWLAGTPMVVITALSSYDDGNLTVFLEGLPTPIVVKLASGEPDSKSNTRVVDWRLDIRVPGRGPNAKAPLLGPNKIALYDDVLQGFLDGVPPQDAKKVKVSGDLPNNTHVWQFNGSLFVRTANDIQTAFDQTMAASDGTRVYRLPLTPYITLSDMGRAVPLQLEIQ